MYIQLTCKQCGNRFRVFESDIENGKPVKCPHCKVKMGKESAAKIRDFCDSPDEDFDVLIAPSTELSMKDIQINSLSRALLYLGAKTGDAKDYPDLVNAFSSEQELHVVESLILGAISNYHLQLSAMLAAHCSSLGDFKW